MAVREIVLPGETVDERKGRKLGEGVYAEEDIVYSKVIGIPVRGDKEIKVIPLSGVYLPKVGDRVIGIIQSVEFSGWVININSPYTAFLPLAEGVREFVDVYRVDLSRYYDVDDVIFCRISKVTKDKNVQVSMKYLDCKKLVGGIVIKITPYKIARLIGKGGSMINLIKSKTKCMIYPGQNGLVWIKGENKLKAIQAILTIEKESHLYGLTEKIQKMLGEE